MVDEVRMHSGSRKRVPNDALKLCPSCGEPRGNRRQGWAAIQQGEQIVGFTCPACPEWSEPIRRIESSGRVRFRAVVDATPRGAVKRRQATSTHNSLDEARRFVVEVRATVGAQGGYSRNDETVRQLCERWMASKQDVRDITRESYRNMLKPVVRHLGDRPVRTLTTADVRDLVAWMSGEGATARAGVAFGPLAVKHAVGRLATALDLAVEDGLIERNPARGRTIKRPRKTRKVGGALEHWPTTGRGSEASCESLEAFRDAADGDDLAGVLRLTLCGLTRADVLGLQWSDFDLDAGTVTIRRGRVPVTGGWRVDEPKSPQRRRTVPFELMQPGTVELLRQLQQLQVRHEREAGRAWVGSDFVVVNELGAPVEPRVYVRRFAAVCKAAKVPLIHLHSVRHTLAFLMHARGVRAADAAALLGHTLEVHLSTYMPESGESGIAAAASALAPPVTLAA